MSTQLNFQEHHDRWDEFPVFQSLSLFTQHEPDVVVYLCNLIVWRLSQEDPKFEAGLGYIVNSRLALTT